MLSTILWFAVAAGVAWLVVFYLIPLIPYALARYNLFWTMVGEGTAKAVMYKWKFHKIIFVKQGYRLAKAGEIHPDGRVADEWDVIPLKPGEKGTQSGLHWVGLWPFYQVHTRTMKFVKALSKAGKDGKLYEERADENTDFILTEMPYQYGLVITDAEDADKLPLSGLVVATSKVVNAYKALFGVKDWFDALSSRIIPEVREKLSEHTFDVLIHNPDVHLDDLVMESMKTVSKGRTRSKFDELRQDYGQEVIALEVVNIDPPESYREVTLRKWTATQNADAEAEETSGALNRMNDARIRKLAKRLGFDEVDYRDNPEENPEFKKLLREERDILARAEDKNENMLLRQLAARSGGLKDNRVANADGSNLGSLEGWLLTFINGLRGEGATNPSGSDSGQQSRHQKRKGRGNQGDNQGDNQGGQNPQPGLPAPPVKSDEESAQEYFDKHKKWPKWDPQKREPN